MNKVALASVEEVTSRDYVQFMDELNWFSRDRGLRQFTGWSKNWEYPWLWFNCLSKLIPRLRILDIGSEISPMPWWMSRSHYIEIAEIDKSPWIENAWRELKDDYIAWHFVDSENLPFFDESFDVVTSFSVIEHQANKELAISEASRVLKKGGTLAMSFDICEPGMEYPAFNGCALTMHGFEHLAWNRPEWGNQASPTWNVEDIPDFLEWHKQSAPHHKYVCGAAILKKK